MKLLRFNATDEPVSRARTGVLLAGDIVGDLRAGYAACLVEDDKDAQGREIAALRIPPDVRQILHAGAPARQALERAAAWLAGHLAQSPARRGVDGEALFVPLAGARLHNPLKPGRLIVIEDGAGGAVARERAPSSVMGPVRGIAMPADADELVYGTGLAIVIGRACHAIDERGALDAVAGCMVANEVHAPARTGAGDLAGDVVFRRCIIGPCLVDLRDTPDIGSLRLVTRVNGAVVQSGTSADWRRSVAKLVARLSRFGLEAGDTLVTGRLSGEAPRLRAGDLLESEIEGLGVLRNRVAAA